MEKNINLIKKVKKSVTHQGIGGKEIRLELELDADTVFNKAVNEGNWACANFMDRRDDFNYKFKHKLYYGKVGGLGYIVAEDELENIKGSKQNNSKPKKNNIFKRLFCKLGWHSFSYELVEEPDDPLHTGVCNKYKCKWCGYVGMKDSQGNLF